jgi:signal peptidase II
MLLEVNKYDIIINEDKIMKKMYIVSLLVILVDRIAKIFVEKFLDGKIVDVIKNFFYLTCVKNEGAAFSILENKVLLLSLLGILALVFLIYFVTKYNKNNIGYFFLIGGIIGNLIDRIFLGYVIDFIGFNIFSYSFPIFNIADIFIVLGALFVIFEKDKK